MKHLSLLIAAFALALGACESHSWEDVKDADGNVTEKGTKRLFESHGGHEEGKGNQGGEGTGHGGGQGEEKPGEGGQHAAGGEPGH